MNNENRKLAPVVIFVYNRLRNTKRVINALRENYLALETEIFIFSDAPKTEKDRRAVDSVRQYAKTITGFKSINIIEREQNFYIEKNIIEGATDVINKYGKIIVLEDDVITAKNFLNYMNDALDFYEDKKEIMHIASFTFIKMPEDYKKTILWRYSENGGGWGTWKNRWDKFKWFKTEKEALSYLSQDQMNKIELEGSFKCLHTLKFNPIPWDICWYIAIIHNNCLAVNPPKSLIKNIGFYGGTHFSLFARLLGKHPLDVNLVEGQKIIFENNLNENIEALGLLKDFYKNKRKSKILSISSCLLKKILKFKF